jgi:DNA repair protein RadC
MTRKAPAPKPDAPHVTAQVLDLPVSRIRPGQQVGNDRQTFEPQALQALADSIAQHGLAQPITVRQVGDEWEIVAGERRFRAIRDLLKWDTIPAIVRTLSDDESAAVMLLENTARVDLNPVEQAMAYHTRLEGFGWSVEQIAKTAGVHPSTVERRLSLFKLAPDLLPLVKSGQLPLHYAEELPRLDHNRQHTALRLLQETDKMTLPGFRALVKQLFAEQQQEALLDPEAFRLKSEHPATPPVVKPYSIPVYRVTLVRDPAMPSAVRQITSSQDAVAVVRQYLAGVDREHFIVLLLDNKHRIIGIHTVSVGSLTASVVHPREVFKVAILANAKAIICAHNHPSGYAAPSQEDRLITAKLVKGGHILGIPVLDHVIIGDGSEEAFSFADQGMLTGSLD